MPGSPDIGTYAQRKNRLSLRGLHQTLASDKCGRAASPSRCRGPDTWGKTRGTDLNGCSPGRAELCSRLCLMSSYLFPSSRGGECPCPSSSSLSFPINMTSRIQSAFRVKCIFHFLLHIVF